MTIDLDIEHHGQLWLVRSKQMPGVCAMASTLPEALQEVGRQAEIIVEHLDAETSRCVLSDAAAAQLKAFRRIFPL